MAEKKEVRTLYPNPEHKSDVAFFEKTGKVIKGEGANGLSGDTVSVFGEGAKVVSADNTDISLFAQAEALQQLGSKGEENVTEILVEFDLN